MLPMSYWVLLNTHNNVDVFILLKKSLLERKGQTNKKLAESLKIKINGYVVVWDKTCKISLSWTLFLFHSQGNRCEFRKYMPSEVTIKETGLSFLLDKITNIPGKHLRYVLFKLMFVFSIRKQLSEWNRN